MAALAGFSRLSLSAHFLSDDSVSRFTVLQH
jgi:hypothetical protein